MKTLLIVYNNGSHIHTFPQGTAYIAAALKEAGHDVEIYQQDVHHWPEEHLTDHLDRNRYDMVGFGFIAGYYQYAKALKISKAVSQSQNFCHFTYVLGGHGPSAEPEYFKEKMGADDIVIGEGETWASGKVYDHVDDLPWPAYQLFPIKYYRLIRFPCAEPTDFCIQILTGRGCKWRCNFCYRMDDGFRARHPEAVIEEIRYLQMAWGINYFQFSDELFMSSEKRSVLFSEALIKANLGKNFKWDCNGRLNFATPEVLKVMKQAGCQYVNYGVEAMDDQVLANMNKGLTVAQIKRGVKATIEAGISPGLNIIWGNIGDTLETLHKGVDFLLEYDKNPKELRTIRPVTPYPGCDLYKYAIEKGLLQGPEDFYERKHVNSDLLAVNFTDLTDDEFHVALMNANLRLIHKYSQRRRDLIWQQAVHLYAAKNVGFRGFRDI